LKVDPPSLRYGAKGVVACEICLIRVNPWLNALFWALFKGLRTSIIVIDAADFGFSGSFPASFIDTARASDKLRPALFRWNSPCEIESAIILKLNIYG
jgi:hypothetical protein